MPSDEPDRNACSIGVPPVVSCSKMGTGGTPMPLLQNEISDQMHAINSTRKTIACEAITVAQGR
jgi:hypothetical protein